jgi:hypothetical protein
MAIQTRVSGDAQAVVNVGTATKNANAVIINTGIASPITAYKVTGMGGNLAAELTVGGAVETVLRAVSGNATVLAYQVDSNSQISVLTERSAVSAADLQLVIRALGANIGAASTVDASAATVASSGGIKLA